MKTGLHYRKLGLIAVLVLCLLPLAAASTALGAEKGVELNYRLKWLFNMSTVGELYAIENNLFTQNGLKVNIKAGGPERDAIKELELGYAQFGVASADQVIRARAKGARVVVVAQLFQINPLQWMYRPDKMKIASLDDLKGKVLGITFGGNDETIMRTLLAKGGITEKDVKLFSVRYDYTPFYRHKVDLWPVYRNTQAVFIGAKLREAGEQVAFFNPADYGVRFVANSVVTSEGLIQEKPQLVAQFVKILMQGWRESLNPANAEATLACVQKYDKDTAFEYLKEQLVITRSLVDPGEGVKIGAIDAQGWEMTEKIMLDQKQIEKPVEIKAALRPIAGVTD